VECSQCLLTCRKFRGKTVYKHEFALNLTLFMETMKSVAFVIRLEIELLFFSSFFKCLLSVTWAIHINLSCAMRKPIRPSKSHLHVFRYICPCQLVGLRNRWVYRRPNIPTVQNLCNTLRCFISLFLAVFPILIFRMNLQIGDNYTRFCNQAFCIPLPVSFYDFSIFVHDILSLTLYTISNWQRP
jgi:hypothetical protein